MSTPPMAPTAPYLIRLLQEFPFQEGRLKDLTAQASDITHIPPDKWPLSFRIHIACMITLTACAMLPKGANKLGFAYRANTPRSGKTLCAQTSICPVFGWAAGRSWPVASDRSGGAKTDEGELRKVLDSAVLEGTPYLFFDNIKATVDSPNLEALMTLPMWTGRYMGTQKTFYAPNNIIPILTGNNLKMSTDLMERFLFVDFFVEQVEARDRAIESVMETHWIMAHRNAIFDAIYGLVEHWNAHDRPNAPGRVARGFESFGNLIGGIVSAAGFGDIFERREEEGASGNVTDNDMRRLVHKLMEDLRWKLQSEKVPTCEFTFHEVVQICWREGLFAWILEGKEQMATNSSNMELHLSQPANARFGAVLRNYAPLKIGRTWELPFDSKIRMQATGQDRARKYVASLELTPRGRIQQLMLRDGISLESLNEWLKAQASEPIDLIGLTDLRSILLQWADIVDKIRATQSALA